MEEEGRKCPVCFDWPMKTPIYNCPNDHALCRECEARLSRCPVCTVRLPKDEKIRNTALEEEQPGILICTNPRCGYGCISQDDLDEHVENCEHRKIPMCKYLGIDDTCKMEFSPVEYEIAASHLRTDHADITFAWNYGTFDPDNPDRQVEELTEDSSSTDSTFSARSEGIVPEIQPGHLNQQPSLCPATSAADQPAIIPGQDGHETVAPGQEGHETVVPGHEGHEMVASEQEGHETVASEQEGHETVAPGQEGHESVASEQEGHETGAPGQEGHETVASEQEGHETGAPGQEGHETVAPGKEGQESIVPAQGSNRAVVSVKEAHLSAVFAEPGPGGREAGRAQAESQSEVSGQGGHESTVSFKMKDGETIVWSREGEEMGFTGEEDIAVAVHDPKNQQTMSTVPMEELIGYGPKDSMDSGQKIRELCFLYTVQEERLFIFKYFIENGLRWFSPFILGHGRDADDFTLYLDFQVIHPRYRRSGTPEPVRRRVYESNGTVISADDPENPSARIHAGNIGDQVEFSRLSLQDNGRRRSMVMDRFNSRNDESSSDNDCSSRCYRCKACCDDWFFSKCIGCIFLCRFCMYCCEDDSDDEMGFNGFNVLY